MSVLKKSLFNYKDAALFLIKWIVWLNANLLKPAIFINGKKLVLATLSYLFLIKTITNQTNNLP